MAEIRENFGDQSDGAARPLYKPIVLSLKKRKKRKSRYSKGLAEPQRIERHLTRVTHRMARAIEKGTAVYRKKRRKSSRNKKDGALRDLIPNSGVAMSRALREASTIPYELSRAVNTKSTRRQLKRRLRAASRSLRR